MNGLHALQEAEQKARSLFKEIEICGLVQAGKSEKQLNKEIYGLAFNLFGIKKYWHKRIVRAGENTLQPYRENPPDRVLADDDILFFDFGPVFDEWEADFGRTYVLGTDEFKLKLASDVEKAWFEARDHYVAQEHITGSEYYMYLKQLAGKYGWEFGGHIGGHLIGNFPHQNIYPSQTENYVHPANRSNMKDPWEGCERYWILEIHFVDREKKIGGFFEQLLQ